MIRALGTGIGVLGVIFVFLMLMYEGAQGSGIQSLQQTSGTFSGTAEVTLVAIIILIALGVGGSLRLKMS